MPPDLFLCVGAVAALAAVGALVLSAVALALAVKAAKEAERLRRRMAAPEPRPPAEGAPEAPPSSAARPAAAGSTEEAVPPHPAVPTPPPRPAPAPPPAGPPGRRISIRWEEWIGLKGLAWGGMVVLLIGAALLAKYLALGPWGRIVAEAVGGFVALAAGEAFARKGYRVLARVATGGGLALEYFAVFSARVLENVAPEAWAWTLMTAVTVVAVVLAVRYASLTVAILALVGGLAAPILIRPARDPGHVLFLYLVAVNLGVLALAYFKKWRVLNLLALLGTVANVAVWLAEHYWHGETAVEKLPLILTYTTVLWAMYFALSIVYHLVGERDPSRLDLPVTLVNVVAYFGGLYALLRTDHHWVLGPAAVALAAVYLAEGLAVRRWAPRHMRFVVLQLAQAIGLATLAIPIQLEGAYIPAAWAVEATVLVWLGLRLGEWRLRAVGLLVHLASVVALGYFAEELWEAGGPVVLNQRAATLGVVAAAMGVSAWLYRRAPRRPAPERVAMTAAAGAAHLVVMVLIGLEAFHWCGEAEAALKKLDLPNLGERIEHLRWLRDVATAVGLAGWGLAAVVLAAAMRRVLHHAMALVAMGAAAVFLAGSTTEAPPLAWLAGLNGVGASFAAVAACLALAAVVSHYARGAGPRAFAIVYELLAVGTVLGLYLTEVFRAADYMERELDQVLSRTSVLALVAAALAVTGGGVMLRGFWMRSLAHRVVGLMALAGALAVLVSASLPGRETYRTLLWQPRGVAFLLTVAAMGLAAVGYLRTQAAARRERRVLGPVLAVLVHVVALGLFTLEAMDFWDAHAKAWFPHETVRAWYGRHATLSVGYALYGLVLLGAGIAWRSRLARVTALVVLGVALAKVMLLDLSRLEAIWRILSFIGLGVLLLAASLLYHRYRHLLFPPEAPPGGKEGGDATD